MSLNKEYTDLMKAGVNVLVENSAYDKVTNHVTFDTSKLDFPKGVTTDSLKTHVEFINEVGVQAEVATAEIARQQYAENDKLTTVDSTLDFGCFTVNSQHHLKQQVGDEFLYGQSTTAFDYRHTEEQSQWVSDQRQANIAEATKLFS